MEIHGFATIACLNHYRAVVSEMLDAVDRSGLYEASAALEIAVLGPEADRANVRNMLAPYPRASIGYESAELHCYEYPAISLLQKHCASRAGPVYYFHTKGVSYGPNDQYAKHWRRLMLHHVIETWEQCLGALGHHDCAGTGWAGNHYSGNYWWATAEHVRRLPQIDSMRRSPLRIFGERGLNDRVQCEFWIGQAPRVRAANFGPRGIMVGRLEWTESRTDVLNALADRYRYRRYLEIGLGEPAWNFDRIRADTKQSVDPAAGATFHVASDEFFALVCDDARWDLIFVDAVHEEEQVLRDIAHALAHLSPGGALVLHDSSPPTEWHQRPRSDYVPGTEWNGTVWRAVVRFRLEHPEIPVYTVDTDFGCTVIRPADSHATELGSIPREEVTWARFQRERDRWLNLIPVREFHRRLGA